ncbi:MAG: circadian clock protein KaiA [Cyanobacteria bacterium J06639_1]
MHPVPSQPLRIALFDAVASVSDASDTSASVTHALRKDRFALERFVNRDAVTHFLIERAGTIDCFVMLGDRPTWPELETLSIALCRQGTLVPAVLVLARHADEAELDWQEWRSDRYLYHNAAIVLTASQENVPDVPLAIDRAIAKFLQVSPLCILPERDSEELAASIHERVRSQQVHLAEKLRERLGYLGVYYKRDPSRFYRRLSADEREQFDRRLRGLYHAIVLEYFQSSEQANRRIDEFAALAFFADLSVSQVLEMHMRLMDDFAKQLKLEGRSEEILLDYRITLIDVIAHLSEMYRRSIPRPKDSAQEAKVRS